MSKLKPKRERTKIQRALRGLNGEYNLKERFLTEADVVAALYSHLIKYFKFKKNKKLRLMVEAKFKRKHLRKKYKGTRYAGHIDLAIGPPPIKPMRSPKIHLKQLDTKKSIGIEIKLNKEHRKDEREKKNWKDYVRLGLRKDVNRLKDFKQGWFIFVDSQNNFLHEEDWRTFVKDDLYRKNRKRRKIICAYLSPVRKQIFYDKKTV